MRNAMNTEALQEHLDRLFKNVSELRQEVISIKLCEEKILQDIDHIKIHFLEKKKRESVKKKMSSSLKVKTLSIGEVDAHKKNFLDLFEKWISGEELYVKNILEAYNAQDLRDFADANNLNVTSKMPKQRVLHLIDARFREKKMLLK